MELPDTFSTAVKLVGGFTIFCVGVSFAWKFFQAAFLGKIAYWSGLERFGFLFIPITWFISPFLIHLPYDTKSSLIHERQQLWVHLVFGPLFFVAALMCMTSGADLMNLPGSTSLNTILTLNRSDVPPCIVYTPPSGTSLLTEHFPYVNVGSYRFPFVKKATRTVIKTLTFKIPEDKSQSYNAYEQRGDDTSQYTKFGGDLFWDDEEEKQAEAQQAAQAARAQGAQSATTQSHSRTRKH